ncbi:LytR C-terminal domain-containing protein [Flexivirga caeni]|uniref:LytR family transcriptional regulator n=1 Tax=Flexivirga caeni TaxID=2294115 RepID=A0A3M9M533_9MICO|nr:LytR C-terminal domain-containing protein [Flexivirga caeni]RNI20650.1 LytR family transcriptional regulator [Flexivirga caeni]
MSYVREDGLAHARRRRQRRSIIVLVVAVLLLFGALFYALAFMRKSTESSPSASSSCAVTTTAPPQSIFTLNVYNASSDSGVAKRTAAALQTHGFTIGTVSNDPYKESLSGVGQIRFGPKGKKDATTYVEKYLHGATLVQDGRTDDSVDVVLGDEAPTIKSAPPAKVSLPPGCSTPTP